MADKEKKAVEEEETKKKAASKKKATKKKASKKKATKKVAKKKVAKKKATKKKAPKATKSADTSKTEKADVKTQEAPVLTDPEVVAPVSSSTPGQDEAAAASVKQDETTRKLQELGVIASDKGDEPNKNAPAQVTPAASESTQINSAETLFRVLYVILIVGAVVLYFLAVYGPSDDVSPQSQAPDAVVNTGVVNEQPAAVEDEQKPETATPSAETDTAGDQAAKLRPLPEDQQKVLGDLFGN